MPNDDEKLVEAVQSIDSTLATNLTGKVSLEKSLPEKTTDQALWAAIKNRTSAIGFDQYKSFIDAVLCVDSRGIEGYRLLFTSEDPALVPSDNPTEEEIANIIDELSKKGIPIDSTRDPETVSTGLYLYGVPDQGCSKEEDPTGPTYYVKKLEGGIRVYRELGPSEKALQGARSSFHGAYGLNSYELLKTATEVFLILNCGVRIENADYDEYDEATRLANWSSVTYDELVQGLSNYLGSVSLPYLERIVTAVFSDQNLITSPFCTGVLKSDLTCPCLLELIWSYWHEEGMLTQTMKAISLRFQNKFRGQGKDPLATFNIDPLRPLNNFLWGYIQDERHRLTLQRRAYEYDSHYGISIQGKAISSFQPADSRSKFLEAFHGLLRASIAYYRDAADATMIPDGFPLLNAIKEVHLELAAGAHNQYRALPWTARVEMLIEKWLLARPEMRDFLGRRAMVPYPEDWMGQVDSMKSLQGWTDTTVRYFRDLGVFGERLLLSLRFGDWSDVTNEDQAKNWANYWKQEVQGYVHSYRATTGVDLTAEISNAEMLKLINAPPAVHLKRRLSAQSKH